MLEALQGVDGGKAEHIEEEDADGVRLPAHFCVCGGGAFGVDADAADAVDEAFEPAERGAEAEGRDAGGVRGSVKDAGYEPAERFDEGHEGDDVQHQLQHAVAGDGGEGERGRDEGGEDE